MSNLGLNKAKGPDIIIENEVLMNLSESLCKSLCMLFNLIANKCHFPIEWKNERNCTDVQRWQQAGSCKLQTDKPTVYCLELLEKIIFNKLYPLVLPFLSESQHGYCSKGSTETNLI